MSVYIGNKDKHMTVRRKPILAIQAIDCRWQNETDIIVSKKYAKN